MMLRSGPQPWLDEGRGQLSWAGGGWPSSVRVTDSNHGRGQEDAVLGTESVITGSRVGLGSLGGWLYKVARAAVQGPVRPRDRD